ncbi:hypothetical protein M433DRAFT_178252 [Acidomyces richmondensis BFW]|nr:hypothetical protein M433DRAFT_178252 [Acidomyces richmondensis BFW]
MTLGLIVIPLLGIACKIPAPIPRHQQGGCGKNFVTQCAYSSNCNFPFPGFLISISYDLLVCVFKSKVKELRKSPSRHHSAQSYFRREPVR